jgi:4-amino-4-deoxy-L-arabinose transferase-like glycosyltransferase
MVPAVFWTALAAGILLKGPLILLIVGLTIVTLTAVDRAARWLLLLRPLPGIVWLAILVAPWFILILTRSGDAFMAESVGRDMLGKIFRGQEGHGAPPGFYFVLFWVTFWPAATLAGIAAPSIWASRQEKGARFLLAWLVPAWIVSELIVTKLPHYVLPLYPAVAILIAGVVDSHRLTRRNWLTHGTAWWFVLPVLIGTSAVVGLIMRSLMRAMMASILISIALFGVVLPSLSALFPSLTLARALRASGCGHPIAAAAGYHEPSLVYLAGTSTKLIDGASAADFLRAGGCRFAFVESRQERSFLRRADAIGLRYSPGARIEAYNYNAGRWVSIAVYRAESGR